MNTIQTLLITTTIALLLGGCSSPARCEATSTSAAPGHCPGDFVGRPVKA